MMDQAVSEGRQGPHPCEEPQNEPEDLAVIVRELRETLEARVAERTAALQAANTELLKSSKAKSEFMARVSHDLRQPLNAVVGFTDLLLLQGGEPLSNSQRRYLGHVVTAAQQIVRLTSDLLDLSRLEAGRLEIHPEPCDVALLLQEMLAHFRTQPQAGQVSLTLEIASPLGKLMVDQARLQQILYNLVSNAFKFTPDGGLITVTARQIGPLIELSVRDTGVGIPLDDQRRIFEVYEQGGTIDIRQKGVGLGLGLATAKRLVELHGGHISVESTPSQGSTFVVRLPGAAPAQGDSQFGENSGPLILVIEDDMAAAELFRTHLTDSGYRVALVASGHAGLGAARRLQPHAITLDLGLPDLDGWEVLYRLKNDPATQGIPVLIVSARDQGQVGFSLGAVDYLVKPVDPKRLLAALYRCQVLGAPRRALRILVVDDEPAVLEALDALLTREGHVVMGAQDGEGALSRAQAERPDIILLDLHLPGLSGFEVVTRLRKIPGLEAVPVVAFSGKFVTPEERTLLTQQAVQFVGKHGAVTIQQLLGDLRRISSLAN